MTPLNQVIQYHATPWMTENLEWVKIDVWDKIFKLTHRIDSIKWQKKIHLLSNSVIKKFIRIEWDIIHTIDMVHYSQLSNPSWKSWIMVWKRWVKKCFVRFNNNQIQETHDNGTVNRKHIFDDYTPTLYQLGKWQEYITEEELDWVTLYEY